jgi:Raf kinase inhibitor-like YbhB/YbcL family protein
MFLGNLKISSPHIEPLKPIAAQHAADSGNVVPGLEISGAPEGTKELAVILHDPDAPLPNGFTHLTIYGIAPSTTILTADQPAGRIGPHGGGQNAYTGPEPPFGHGVHHYYFWVYALDTAVEGEPSREEFLTRYAGNIIEQARFVATYRRD